MVVGCWPFTLECWVLPAAKYVLPILHSLYLAFASEHPRLVSLFDNAAAVDEDEDGYHISKAWLKGSVVAVVFRISSPLIVPS